VQYLNYTGRWAVVGKFKNTSYERVFNIKKQSVFLFDKGLERYPYILGRCAGN
jgi:hypothetical protein